MTEYLSEAVVLNKMPSGEFDIRVSVYTKLFGKLVVKAKSARKITSKLSGHLEPGTHARIRIVEKGGQQVVDALKYGRVPASHATLATLSSLLAEGESDLRIWNELTSPVFSWQRALLFLGWDPTEAVCDVCGRERPGYFEPRQQRFVCADCAHARNATHALLYIAES